MLVGGVMEGWIRKMVKVRSLGRDVGACPFRAVNTTCHRFIEMAPEKVTLKREDKLWNDLHGKRLKAKRVKSQCQIHSFESIF